jgi:hypothetical protein
LEVHSRGTPLLHRCWAMRRKLMCSLGEYAIILIKVWCSLKLKFSVEDPGALSFPHFCNGLHEGVLCFVSKVEMCHNEEVLRELRTLTFFQMLKYA